MAQEIRIEKKASEIIQPETLEEARQAIKVRKDLSGAYLQGLNLQNLNASRAILRKVHFKGADLSQGWFIQPNFYRAVLHGTAMRNTILIGGDLVKTDFTEADLSNSGIIGADAQEAGFSNACLQSIAIVNTNLRDADFTHADLTNARLAALNVTGADFTGADLTGARAYQIDWSKAKVPPAAIPGAFLQTPGLDLVSPCWRSAGFPRHCDL